MRNDRLLPYETIVQATSGEPEAVNAVLQYYGWRIRSASRISGQADKEAEDFITEALLKALFKFRFDRVTPPVTTE
ncbi:helix-turn-helix domain-containing protein [bacterium]|nr:helix-turn-helix domain-containing protein [bacterium]